MSEYTHYIQKEGEEVKNLETVFGNIRYMKCEGLNTKGKRKNVYTENFSDSDNLRVWMGEDVAREATKITLTLCFIGEEGDRKNAFDSLYNYIKNKKFYYWDTARLKKVCCVLVDEFKPIEEKWYGSTPYMTASISLQNLWGESKDCRPDGTLVTNP